MRSSKAQHGPFEERLHYELDEIDRICVEALEEVGCLPKVPSPIRIERFIEKRFKCTVAYEDLDAGILGCTIFTPEGKVKAVLISSKVDDGTSSGERRVRSTYAHEAGHCLLHAHLFIQDTHTQNRFDFDRARPPQNRIMCRPNDIGGVEAKQNYDGKWWEYQANRAIGGLLLPKSLVTNAVRDFLGIHTSTGFSGIPAEKRAELERHISGLFEVNPIVARIRIGEMWPKNAGSSLF